MSETKKDNEKNDQEVSMKLPPDIMSDQSEEPLETENIPEEEKTAPEDETEEKPQSPTENSPPEEKDEDSKPKE